MMIFIDQLFLGLTSNAKEILIWLYIATVLTICDLLVSHYYLHVPLTRKFVVRSIFANIICIITILLLEDAIKIGTGIRTSHLDALTGLFGTVVKILIYGKSLPGPLFNKKSFLSIFISTYIGMIGGIVLMFIGNKIFMQAASVFA